MTQSSDECVSYDVAPFKVVAGKYVDNRWSETKIKEGIFPEFCQLGLANKLFWNVFEDSSHVTKCGLG